jgi:hypothetical protein
MALTCISDVYDSIESVYSRYLAQSDLGNQNNQNILSDVLMRVCLLIDIIKIADIDSDLDAIAEYCDELENLLNYTE